MIKKDLDEMLNQVDYKYLNSTEYIPSEFALTFMNFIKLVNGAQGESHKTPPVHLAMLDKIASGSKRIANLCYRGSGKTTLMCEYLIPYIAIFNYLPGFGKIDGIFYVSDSMENGVKSLRKQIEHRYNNSEFLQHWIPEASFTDAYMEFTNKEGNKTGVRGYGGHTAIRGGKIFAQRPQLALIDDVVSDDDSKSKVSMEGIKDTIYNGVMNALAPKNMIIFNGTPFNKTDILVEAVESGAWDVNVWPICERFPCTKAEFQGAWPDRFNYEAVKDRYDVAVAAGRMASFNQELMLRISSEEDRLIDDGDIRWYKRDNLLAKRSIFNFYITTDFATSERDTSDFSVISVWAYNSKGHWFWVDGVCKRQTMDKNVDDLFRLVSEYNPQQVGVEVTGQQGAFISWLQNEMLNRNIWFNFASSGSGVGIRPANSKLARLNIVVPWFKAGHIFFPDEMRTSTVVGEFMQEIKMATHSGIKGHDDCLDTISMLGYLKPWKPSESSSTFTTEADMWEDAPREEVNALSSYLV